MTAKRQPIDYAAQVAARRAAAAAPAPQAPMPPQSGGTSPGSRTEAPAPADPKSGPVQENGREQQAGANGQAAREEEHRSPNHLEVRQPAQRRIGVSADRPTEKKKVDRQGIDLRPIDRQRWTRFEMFCLDRRLRLGKKRGLTQYARAGLQLLDELMTRDPNAAEALLQSVAEAPTPEA